MSLVFIQGLGGQVFTIELALCWQCQLPRNYPGDEERITKASASAQGGCPLQRV